MRFACKEKIYYKFGPRKPGIAPVFPQSSVERFLRFPRFLPFFSFDGPDTGKKQPFAAPVFPPSKAEIWV